MKVAIVSASITRRSGGIRDSLLGVTRELVRAPDTEVRVLGLAEDDAESDFQRWGSIPIETFPVRGIARLGYAPGLVTGLMESGCDLAHTHAIWMYPSAAVASWHEKTGRPYLISPHGMLDPWAVRNSKLKKRIAYSLYERRHLEKTRCFHALCESEAKAIRAFGLRNPIAVIPNGIEIPQRGNGAAPTDAKLSADGRKILLYIGRIHPKKGLANLLKAWSSLRKKMGGGAAGWVLVIAGWDQGGHEEQLKALAAELEIPWVAVTGQEMTIPPHASVAFVGPRFNEDKARCYAGCDAFVLPSFSEGLPMAVLEAWAYGKPVLMTTECNLPEGATAGAAMEIQSDERSVAEGLSAFLSAGDAERQSMGAKGVALIHERFTWSRIAHDLRSVYQWALGGGPAPHCVTSN